MQHHYTGLLTSASCASPLHRLALLHRHYYTGKLYSTITPAGTTTLASCAAPLHRLAHLRKLCSTIKPAGTITPAILHWQAVQHYYTGLLTSLSCAAQRLCMLASDAARCSATAATPSTARTRSAASARTSSSSRCKVRVCMCVFAGQCVYSGLFLLAHSHVSNGPHSQCPLPRATGLRYHGNLWLFLSGATPKGEAPCMLKPQ